MLEIIVDLYSSLIRWCQVRFFTLFSFHSKTWTIFHSWFLWIFENIHLIWKMYMLENVVGMLLTLLLVQAQSSVFTVKLELYLVQNSLSLLLVLSILWQHYYWILMGSDEWYGCISAWLIICMWSVCWWRGGSWYACMLSSGSWVVSAPYYSLWLNWQLTWNLI